MRYLAAILLCLTLPANAQAEEDPAPASEQSPFVGRYDGSGMEMAMGMVVRPDGTFEWRMSVGALDLRAAGTWEEADGRIRLTSTPKPTPPEFAFSRLETRAGEPWLRIVWAENGKPFQYGDVVVTCANGHTLSGQVRQDGFPHRPEDDTPGDPDQQRSQAACDKPVSVRLKQSNYYVASPEYDLRELGWQPGSTALFEFRANDLGLADFSGVTGQLIEDRIVLDVRSVGRRDMPGPLEMRKLPANGD